MNRENDRNFDDEPSAQEPGQEETHPTSLTEKVQNTISRYENFLLNREATKRPLLGLPKVDELLGGLRPGRVYVVASRPSIGKTSLVLQSLSETCLKESIPSLFISADLHSQEVVDRLVFNRAFIGVNEAFNEECRPTKGELERVANSIKEITAAKLHIEDASTLSIEALVARTHELSASNSIGFIAIDHLHILERDNSIQHVARKQEIAVIMRQLRKLARDLELPILVTAHLKRRTEGRVPTLADIRESGSIEYEADAVCLLYQDPAEDNPNRIEILVAKNNDGPTGHTHSWLLREHQRFIDKPILTSEEREMISAWQDHQDEKESEIQSEIQQTG